MIIGKVRQSGKLWLSQNRSDLYKHSLPKWLSLFACAAVIATFSAEAAITSVTTKQTIQGSAPYFSFDGGVTKAKDTSSLLAIKLSDGTLLSPANNNSSSASNPIILPKKGETLADIEMLIPTTTNNIELNSFIGAPYYYAKDDNGDNQFNATGTLSVNITDIQGNIISDRTAILDSCHAPYKMTLNSTNSTLTTLYGDPNSTHYEASSATYFIQPQHGNAFARYAQPSLSYSGSNPNGGSNLDGPASEWDNRKGFLLQDICNPAANFPSTGMNGLFFNLSISNPEGEISYTKEPKTSGIDLDISTVDSNRVRVMLKGPKQNANSAIAETAMPTTFTIRSGTTPVYTFKIDKWFIAAPPIAVSYDVNYCSKLFGSNYHVSKITELTNANGSGWNGGLPGQKNYQRRIHGGLLAEWGSLIWDGYYPTDINNYMVYWTQDKSLDTPSYQYTVNFYRGLIFLYEAVSDYPNYICVK